MSENVDKHIEKLVDKAMKDATLETPSFNFTAHVMSQVEAIAKPSTTVYKPLISNKVWIFLFGCVVVLAAFSVFGTQPESKNWFDTIDYSIFSNNRVTNAVSGFRFSQTSFYAILMCAVMLFIQVPLLKHYFNKRMEF